MNNLGLRPVGDLLNENFFIPRYQRGYRWGKQEVDALLDDVLQYYERVSSHEPNVGNFYCLQPVVVKPKKWEDSAGNKLEGFELIDGQQRLTTIFIILTYLEKVREEFYDQKKDIYRLDFETRENCFEFFDQKKFVGGIDFSNVDYYHISTAYQHVVDWFSDKLTLRLEILKTFLNKNKNVSIIWYNTGEEANSNDDISIEVFTSLNEGKIPLTDAELIKALILQSDMYAQKDLVVVKQRLFEIASEWDEFESHLQDDRMWLFLNDVDYTPSSRIEFIFKLLADEWNSSKDEPLIKYEKEDGKPKNFEYLVFDRYLIDLRESDQFIDSNSPTPEVDFIWSQIKTRFERLNEWYKDHVQFHLIGLIMVLESRKKGQLIKELIDLEIPKSQFEGELRKRIAKSIKIKKKKENSDEIKEFSDLTYGDDNNEIGNILLLSNVETLIGDLKEDARFPFHLYKKDKITSIEHIHPQNPENIDKDEARCIEWLKAHKVSAKEIVDDSSHETLKKIEDLIDVFDKKTFKEVYSEILIAYSETTKFKENEKHTMYNLALVDKDTNASLNNSFFDVKRELLKENKGGRYIPIVTKRAFSKYYSKGPKEMIFWNSEDRTAYFNFLKEIYTRYLSYLN